ncbi:hypothetical protein [Gemmata sp.]|uniref:hypothetical protein n=1 Tax=Gemmata sp. TaxID=1914242 RepID=UPI003F6F66B9
MRNQAFAVAVVALWAGAAAAQDTVENPEFASWSKFPKGTAATLKVTSSAAGTTSETTMVSTLVEVGADKLVIETVTALKANGMEFKQPALKRDVTKTVAVPKGVKKEDFTGGKPPGTVEEGTETVKISGTEVKAKWYKYKTEAGGVTIESKMWTATDVPGIMVKMESTTTGSLASTTKMELVEIKKP